MKNVFKRKALELYDELGETSDETINETSCLSGLLVCSIQSELELPELVVKKEEEQSNDIDIVIEIEDLHTRWLNIKKVDSYFLIKENICMFEVPGVAIFLVESGKRIVVSPMKNVQEKQLRLFILGSCMGAILMQRGILPLHGSAIEINGKAYAIVGDSGAGKSTLATVFIKKGYPLISDDVIPVTLKDGNIPYVTPSYPQQKLWMESLEQFGMEASGYEPLMDRETKFSVPVKDQFVHESLPLAGIFVLEKTTEHQIKLQSIENMERFLILFQHTYRNFYIEEMGLMNWHFDTCARMVNQIKLYQLTRPISRFTPHELADLILNVTKSDLVYTK